MTATETLSVLIVDDHQMVRTGMRMMLQSFDGHDGKIMIKEAKDGEEAITKALKEDFDIILLDFNMPKLKGDEVISRLLFYKPNQKIIVVSNFDEESYITSCLKLGARGYVLKDIEVSELFYCIGKVLEGEVYLPPHVSLIILEEQMKNSEKDNVIAEFNLSKRELEIMNLLGKELSNVEIGKKLNISKRTVDAHRQNIMHKLNLKSTAGLIKFILTNKIAD